ncbi:MULTISPECIES: hypothetical protein [Streptomyces]|uniref:Uncharacterized protein n=1 Tax=Streptomyces virginiae TaxID=1961 RepID=A0ABQ3NTY8_STRVG|nr:MULTISPECIES: hypothetical protein [Streptomyces]MBP2345396.1 hypothetical protein [Streptomyces virginiae]MCI4082721.1 hypothetical protein [Streptomyces sp. MMS21 TC-5]GGP86146.1 hypothetical protein GCM10010215_09710 [Streptomyces virginiae]GHI16245.1 hypothetical protein Scinn_57080 [Streptomyces virginiae]GLV89473.1 hypothetical protein Slala04_09270 [Streptomyces lavendulae subsp. lavendulae]
MIASTPVARWTWGDFVEGVDPLVRCLADLTAARSVPASYRLALGEPTFRLTVSEAGRPAGVLFQGELTAGGSVEELSDTVRTAMRPGRIGSVDARSTVAGSLVNGGEELSAEGLFDLNASVDTNFAMVELITYSDAWMPYDLKGRAQSAVYEANAPRLEAVLAELTRVLGSDMDPEDPTYFGTPTGTGVVNRLEQDGTPSDSWSRYEIPRRYDAFTHAPGFGRIGYHRSVTGDVRYVPVVDGRGVLGYLWASEAEPAASFEPVDLDDDERYRAALAWLDRLRSAFDRGLSPSQALTELTGRSLDDAAGPLGLPELRARVQGA